ncbi:hypothetical protein IX303_001933 [Porphyromonas levii]|nr:hypothetical protein [Porphyromonas levii]
METTFEKLTKSEARFNEAGGFIGLSIGTPSNSNSSSQDDVEDFPKPREILQ